VWEALCGIPYGQTTTYGALANALPGVTSPRAVGAAVGRNPVSVIVPCHRVVGRDGSLTGYAGGLDRKARMLTMEREGGRR
jgi:methylated-DNA-[protein]-cysteine S-methyltransferase